ncbi:phage minor head protein [Variovorax sp. NFACC27]|uniref:phage head morphogenesis protein n=1 Tax=unclassified Variovorax TaxID=663243 RepID=UPI00089716F3|nr:Phage Mu protein F like protein [Variovorax sp. NFACC28]SEG89660.1 Phage Mu protein F like protein [Variovorax sp. NFACC29]SFD40265.1 Phage Mu protein F like protein [Variovorax sp. NFACC26]SFG42542.1 Phage Mu protein F like protein [Variovorax sp. NFACC27]
MSRKLVSPTGKDIKLKAIHANAGIEAKYRKELQALIAEMSNSVIYWTRAAWKKDDPILAQDRLRRREPLVDLRRTMDRLGKHWQKRFDDVSEKLAKVFVDGATATTDAAMMASLKEAGFTVRFRMTQAAKEGYQAVLRENVGLIRSIPAEYLKSVEGDVFRAVSQGYDLQALTNKLHQNYGVTNRRATIIARDQSNKAKAVIENVRRKELGIETAIWQHSGGGREPRPSHVAASGKTFDLTKGMYLDGEWVLPGQAINCRCTSRAVIPGFEDD